MEMKVGAIFSAREERDETRRVWVRDHSGYRAEEGCKARQSRHREATWEATAAVWGRPGGARVCSGKEDRDEVMDLRGPSEAELAVFLTDFM